jgi:toxin YoeB
MQKLWTDRAWSDYLYWQTQDKKTLKRVNELLRDIERNSNIGIGKPEPMRGELSGWWSRRIDDTNRILYRLKDGNLEISQCRGHYDDN